MPCSHGASWKQSADFVKFVWEMDVNSIGNLRVFVATHTHPGARLLILDLLSPWVPGLVTLRIALMAEI